MQKKKIRVKVLKDFTIAFDHRGLDKVPYYEDEVIELPARSANSLMKSGIVKAAPTTGLSLDTKRRDKLAAEEARRVALEKARDKARADGKPLPTEEELEGYVDDDLESGEDAEDEDDDLENED